MNVSIPIKLILAGLVSEGVITSEQGDRMYQRMVARFAGDMLDGYENFTVTELAKLINPEV